VEALPAASGSAEARAFRSHGEGKDFRAGIKAGLDVSLPGCVYLVGEFLLDREGIIRWFFTEVAEGGKNLFGAPTPQDLMSAALRVAG
jgi:hypothetical protein